MEPRSIKRPTKTVFFILLVVLFLIFIEYDTSKGEVNQTLAIILNPKVNDIYFLDFRLLSEKLRPTEKYRIAKVVDITGDIVTLVYGSFFYQRHHAAMNSIQYGQLSYKDYFESKRYDIPLNTVKNMQKNRAIYLAKRPIRGKLLGNLVGPEINIAASSHLTYGKNENMKGEAFLKEQFSETNLQTAFELFQRSSNFGYVKGQVNLAEMYINGQYVKKDFTQALYWLKQASLQGYKAAILKYEIICKQIISCDMVDFYQELTASGVNIKVRKFDFKLSK
tara:strand:- start:122 stop:958 length:837 start_codon:yes stop_codon:yes gene_type:complete